LPTHCYLRGRIDRSIGCHPKRITDQFPDNEDIGLRRFGPPPPECRLANRCPADRKGTDSQSASGDSNGTQRQSAPLMNSYVS